MQERIKNMLAGKRGIITGVANELSISWAIAKLAKEQGAEIALTYQGEILKKRITPLAEEIGCNFVQQCDVTDESALKTLFDRVKDEW
jgi:enoyl-[acyl-carrier protein] reductase I